MADIKEIVSLLENPTEKDIALIKKAYDFAEKAHTGYKRNNGEPYFNHVFATAKNIAELGMGSTTIAAGFLHDVIEDTEIKAKDIEREFGKEILFLVEGVTKLGEIRYRGVNKHNESLRKLFVAMSEDIRVLIIKLCDRLHNMQTLEYVPKDKQLRIAKETLEIYSPIAYRLGIKKLQRALENLAFAYVYPEDYAKIKKIIKKKQTEVEKYLDNFQKAIKKELARNNVTDFHMEYRAKSYYSLYRKLQKYKGDIDSIFDISAIRIITKNIPDCYRILGIIHSVWKPLPGRIKDYISSPTPNGYRSIHTTIFTGNGDIIEIQIRTEEMNKEAEYGIAAHIFYKEDSETENANFQWIRNILPGRNTLEQNGTSKTNKASAADVPNWVKELVEYQKEAGDEFIDDIKSDFFEERIFIFTPKSDVIDLPKESSVIDFAYAIHTDVGEHMFGARVNGKFVAIDTILKNADRVEIETKKSAKPSYKWLEHCKTTVARRRISHFLEEKRK